MTVKGQQNRKRKLSDSPLQPKDPKKAGLSTPQAKGANTPQQQKAVQKAQTPKQQQKNTPKSAKNSGNKKQQMAKSKEPIKKELSVEDDEDEEEDDDDVDDDEEDEEEDTEVVQPSNKKIKLESPVKGDKSPIKVEQQEEKVTQSQTLSGTKGKADKDRKADFDARTLFLKNLPGNCSVKEIKALSNDIKLVRLRINVNKFNKKQQRTGYAYVEFASEEIAEKNFKILSDASVKGNKLVVDYVGAKSNFKRSNEKTEADELDPLKLYVAGLPTDATESDMRKFFPKAKEIVIPVRKRDKKVFGYAFISFATAQLAKEYHDKTQDAELRGMTLVVLFAKKKKSTEQKKTEKKDAGKKQKKDVKKNEPEKMEADDDEEDDDEEDDDEEDDDEDAEGEDDDEEDDDDDEDDDDGEDDDDE